MRHEFATIVLLCMALMLCGCFEEHLRTPGIFDALCDTVDALALANTASTPVNPYATPVSIGLVGVSAILEALRRKERSARKHAEQKLNGNGHDGGCSR